VNPSWRKPVGMLAIVAAIGVWAVLVVNLVEWLAPPMPLDGVLYLAGGVAWLWVLPMRRMLRWMETGAWRG